MAKLNFQQPLLQSRDPSEIILICEFSVQDGESNKKQHLFEIEIFFNNTKVFAVIFDFYFIL